MSEIGCRTNFIYDGCFGIKNINGSDILSRLQIISIFLLFYSLNFNVYGDGVNFRKPVICKVGHVILVDHGLGENSEDYCIKENQVDGASLTSPAACPKFDKDSLRKTLLGSSFLALERYGSGIQNVIERLILYLNREDKLTFDKQRHRGRDICEVSINSKDIDKFLLGK